MSENISEPDDAAAPEHRGRGGWSRFVPLVAGVPPVAVWAAEAEDQEEDDRARTADDRG